MNERIITKLLTYKKYCTYVWKFESHGINERIISR